MIAAIVLSAGESSRMGTPKALLPIGGKSFAGRIVSALKSSKVGKIVVVLGHRAEEIQKEIEPLSVSIVVNKDYAQGQLSSLIAGLRSLETEKLDGVLVHLVDHPFLDPSLVNLMIDRFYETGKLIVVPRYQGKRGHPVLFSRKLFAELLSAPPDQGARAVVRAHREETLEIDTEDEGVIVDIDTREVYQRYKKRG